MVYHEYNFTPKPSGIFASSTERFKDKEYEGAGLTYADTERPVQGGKPTSNFRSSTPRFEAPARSGSETPCSFDYEPNNKAIGTGRKVTTPFRSQSERFKTRSPVSADVPHAYDTQDSREISVAVQKSKSGQSAFRSRTERFPRRRQPETPSGRQDPYYEVQLPGAFDKALKGRGKGTAAFGSRGPRFGPQRSSSTTDVEIAEYRDPRSIGGASNRRASAAFSSATERFSQGGKSKSITQGPGYEYSSVESSLVKKRIGATATMRSKSSRFLPGKMPETTELDYEVRYPTDIGVACERRART